MSLAALRRFLIRFWFIIAFCHLPSLLRAQTIEYDFASDKFTVTREGGAAVGIAGGSTVNTKAGAAINVRVINLNTNLYKAVIEAKEVPTVSQSNIDTLIALLGGTAPAQRPFTQEVVRLKDTDPLKKYIGARGALAVIIEDQKKLKESTSNLLMDGTRQAVPKFRKSVKEIISSSAFGATDVASIDARYKSLLSEARVALQGLGLDRNKQDEALFLDTELTFIAEREKASDENISAFKKAVDPSTFVVEKPLTLGDSDIQYTLSISAIADKPAATLSLPATHFTFRASREPSNVSYGLFYDPLTDDEFYKRSGVANNGEDPTANYIARSVRSDFTVTLGALYHVPFLKIGDERLAISLGAGLKSDEKFRGLIGLSLFFGDDRRAVLTAGLSYTKVDRLNVFDSSQPFAGDSIPTKSVTRGGFFVGLSYRR